MIMTTTYDDIDENAKIINLVEQSLTIQTHYQLLNWLQGDLQVFLPHDILISAWGDFSLEIMYLDVVAIHPLIRTNNIDKDKLKPQIKSLLSTWQESSMNPVTLSIEDGYLDIHASIKSHAIEGNHKIRDFDKMASCLIHGIQDNRGHDDCLYLFLSNKSSTQQSKKRVAIFLPFIDAALRRIAQLASENKANQIENEPLNPTLTNRECEIMNLVKDGKTNGEIADILDISSFTVKNHLQRIFKKLDANNRSQATFKYKTQ